MFPFAFFQSQAISSLGSDPHNLTSVAISSSRQVSHRLSCERVFSSPKERSPSLWDCETVDSDRISRSQSPPNSRTHSAVFKRSTPSPVFELSTPPIHLSLPPLCLSPEAMTQLNAVNPQDELASYSYRHSSSRARLTSRTGGSTQEIEPHWRGLPVESCTGSIETFDFSIESPKETNRCRVKTSPKQLKHYNEASSHTRASLRKTEVSPSPPPPNELIESVELTPSPAFAARAFQKRLPHSPSPSPPTIIASKRKWNQDCDRRSKSLSLSPLPRRLSFEFPEHSVLPPVAVSISALSKFAFPQKIHPDVSNIKVASVPHIPPLRPTTHQGKPKKKRMRSVDALNSSRQAVDAAETKKKRTKAPRSDVERISCASSKSTSIFSQNDHRSSSGQKRYVFMFRALEI